MPGKRPIGIDVFQLINSIGVVMKRLRDGLGKCVSASTFVRGAKPDLDSNYLKRFSNHSILD